MEELLSRHFSFRDQPRPSRIPFKFPNNFKLKEIPMSFDDFELIYSYSRKQAIQDGVLIDVSDQAKASGFKIPVCIGDRLYHGYVVPPEGLEGEGQSL